MKKINAIVKWIIGSCILLAILLAAHIYLVTRPKTANEHTISMARIDVKRDFDNIDTDRYAKWLYRQTGVEHVMCNPTNNNIVFTYFPLKNSADKIVHDFTTNFNTSAARYVPSAEEMKSGCPAAAHPGGVIGFLKGIFQ